MVRAHQWIVHLSISVASNCSSFFPDSSQSVFIKLIVSSIIYRLRQKAPLPNCAYMGATGCVAQSIFRLPRLHTDARCWHNKIKVESLTTPGQPKIDITRWVMAFFIWRSGVAHRSTSAFKTERVLSFRNVMRSIHELGLLNEHSWHISIEFINIK